MKFFTSRRFYVILIISSIISLFLVLPMLLGLMGYDIFNRRPASMPLPPNWLTMMAVVKQGLFYFVMVFLLMTVNTAEPKKISGWYKALLSFIIIIVFFFLYGFVRPAPPDHQQLKGRPDIINVPSGQERPVFPSKPEKIPGKDSSFRGGFNYRGMSELLFIFIITLLSGKVFELLNQKQQIQFENEKLRSENLQNRYDALLSQINPHFFFNTLNSLASLVREGRNENALRYIEEMANTFRYTMQSTGKELVTVEEEMASASAFCYLFQIRFEEKLYFEINVEEEAKNMLIPVLALLPLIENVVKHNVITSDEPLTITITGNATGITVINPLKPRKDKIEQGGMGLRNLKNRYKLRTGMDIIIENDGVIFSVTLPLVNPEKR